MIFTIYADLDLGRPVQTEAATFAAGFRPNEEACVWTDQGHPTLLRVSFNIDGVSDDFEAAIQAASAELKAVLAAMPFDARPVSLNALTDEAQATWTA